MSHSKLFDETIVSNIGGTFTATTSTMVYNQIKDIIKSNFLDSLVSQQETYADWLNHYNSTFLIVNPTKEKFSDTLLNKNYYELLRIFSNELEKESPLLVVEGFSFKDEHILDLLKRSMINPTLKILLFCYEEKNIEDYEKYFSGSKNNNITYICLENARLSIEQLNQILSLIHT